MLFVERFPFLVYSNRSQVKLNEIVTGLGGDFVNAFPVPPTKKIRLTHKSRPGFTPTKIQIDLNLAGGGNNYSDFSIQFFLVPGGVNSALGLEVGNEYDGNLFLNKDGTQISVPFPEYRGQPLDVGSLETLAVVITNNPYNYSTLFCYSVKFFCYILKRK